MAQVFSRAAGVSPSGDRVFRLVIDDADDPTVSDDETEDYAVGDKWINTASGVEFTCFDASTGAAVWKAGAVTATGALGTPVVVPYSDGATYQITAETYIVQETAAPGAAPQDFVLPVGPVNGAEVTLRNDSTNLPSPNMRILGGTETIEGGGPPLGISKPVSLSFKFVDAGSTKTWLVWSSNP
jgi:hypothetical protein